MDGLAEFRLESVALVDGDGENLAVDCAGEVVVGASKVEVVDGFVWASHSADLM